MSVKERVVEFIKHLNISVRQFERECGLSYGYVSNMRVSIQPDKLMNISKQFPQLNTGWLMTGEGEMIKPKETSEIIKDGEAGALTEGRVIPLYDADAAAGNAYGVNMSPARPVEMIQIGGFLRESEAALRVYGNSMTPNYPPGCIIGTKRWNERFIEPGHVYVVETNENRFLKRLLYNKDKTAYRCLSDNAIQYESGPAEGEFCYPEFEIPVEDVRRIFRVIGVIKRNTI